MMPTTNNKHTRENAHAQKAAMRACRNAIEFNSIPSIRRLVPGGYDNLRLHVKIGVPRPARVWAVGCVALRSPVRIRAPYVCVVLRRTAREHVDEH